MDSHGSPWGGGRVRGAPKAVGDGELIGEEEVAEEALRLRVIAIGSGLKLVLGEEEVTGERIPGSGSDGGGGGVAVAGDGEQSRVERR
jgi:hypothetical protein